MGTALEGQVSLFWERVGRESDAERPNDNRAIGAYEHTRLERTKASCTHAQGTLKSTLFLVYLEVFALNVNERDRLPPSNLTQGIQAVSPGPASSVSKHCEIDEQRNSLKKNKASRTHAQGTL